MSKWFRMMMALTVLCMWSGLAFAQEVQVRSFAVSAMDYTASQKNLKDGKGKVCAAVKVQVPKLDRLSFREALEVLHTPGEYTVFVPCDTKQLTILDGDKQLLLLSLADWDLLPLLEAATYQLVLGIDRQFNVAFQVTPASAKVEVNGQRVALDANGVGSFDYMLGQSYNYTVTMDGYESYEGSFMVMPEDELLPPLQIVLNPKTAAVEFDSNVKEFELFVDGEHWGIVKRGQPLPLPVGEHQLEAVARDKEAWTRKVTVYEGVEKNLLEVKFKKTEMGPLRTRKSLVAGGGVAFPFEDRMQMDKGHAKGFPFRLGFDWEIYLVRWLSLRPGVEAEYFGGTHMRRAPGVSEYPIAFNFSLPLSLNLPLGKFNRNHFAVGVGPVVGYLSYTGDDNSGNEEDEEDLMYGVRADVRFTFNHFILGVNADYVCSQDILGKDGLVAPMVYVGYRF